MTSSTRSASAPGSIADAETARRMIGEESLSALTTCGSSTSFGSRPVTLETAFFTSVAAILISTLWENSATIRLRSRDEEDEIVDTPSTSETAPSMIAVTSASTASGVAPG